MTNRLHKKDPLLAVFDSTFVRLPVPSNISFFWNFGSLLFLCLVIQLVTGVMLAASYAPSIDNSFSLISHLMVNSDTAWLTRYMHANGASLFFVCLYLHLARGLYYSSFQFTHTWMAGVTILILTMAAAFLGYVLPVNQMSFWGASVITNLFTEVPFIGPSLVEIIWGDCVVSSPTITRFFSFHFLLPFIILALAIIHITYLHSTGSSNPLGIYVNIDKTPFHPYFSTMDMMGALLISLLFMLICLYFPLVLGDDENFSPANPSVTPHHIQPEWYFLFAYAILRSIPNKLGGVIALALSVIVFYVLPYLPSGKIKNTSFYPLNKHLFWIFVCTSILLTWIGMNPVEDPYIMTGQILTVLYFSYFVLSPLFMSLWDNLTQ